MLLNSGAERRDKVFDWPRVAARGVAQKARIGPKGRERSEGGAGCSCFFWEPPLGGGRAGGRGGVATSRCEARSQREKLALLGGGTGAEVFFYTTAGPGPL